MTVLPAPGASATGLTTGLNLAATPFHSLLVKCNELYPAEPNICDTRGPEKTDEWSDINTDIQH